MKGAEEGEKLRGKFMSGLSHDINIRLNCTLNFNFLSDRGIFKCYAPQKRKREEENVKMDNKLSLN
jgi:hypothetical protein